jgi:hypothetical protein
VAVGSDASEAAKLQRCKGIIRSTVLNKHDCIGTAHKYSLTQYVHHSLHFGKGYHD